MAEYADSKTGLVADVDCTTSGKSLCEKVGVRGYPTIKYGDPNNLEDYEGGRTLEALQDFAKENLKPKCSPINLDLCDDATKSQIEGFMAMDEAALRAAVKTKHDEQEEIEGDFKTDVEALQAKYAQLQKDKDEGIANVKKTGLGLMQAVMAHKQKEKAEL